MLKNKKREDYSTVRNLIKTSDIVPSKKDLELDLSEFVHDEEEDAKMSAEELKDHEDKEKLDNLDLVTEEVKRRRKVKLMCVNVQKS